VGRFLLRGLLAWRLFRNLVVGRLRVAIACRRGVLRRNATDAALNDCDRAGNSMFRLIGPLARQGLLSKSLNERWHLFTHGCK
jgi:hypothetical protein